MNEPKKQADKNRLVTRYAIAGFVLGILLPITGVLLDLVVRNLSPTSENVAQVIRGEPLYWLVASVPVVLAVLAATIGSRQLKLIRLSEELEEIVAQKTESYTNVINVLVDRQT